MEYADSRGDATMPLSAENLGALEPGILAALLE